MRDPKTENWLKAGRYAFKFVPDLPLDRIDAEAANPARMEERIDKPRVESIALAMIDGTPMPAIVVFDGSPKHLLATGLHRVEAAKVAEVGALDAYVVVEPDDYRRAILLRGINTIEGRAPTSKEMLQHVQQIMTEFPSANVDAIGAAFRLRPVMIRDYLRERAVESRGDDLGVSDALACEKVFTQRLKLDVGSIKNDDLFVRTVRTLHGTQTRGRIATELVKEIKQARNDAQRGRLLDQFVREHEEAQERSRALGGRRKQDTPTKMMRLVSAVAKKAADFGYSVAKLELSALDHQQLNRDIEIVGSALGWLEKIAAEMKRLQAEHEKAQAVRRAA